MIKKKIHQEKEDGEGAKSERKNTLNCKWNE